ncbi:MAG: archaetidylserine decarboxylase [Vicinamibacteria bacterium]|nr:archaetidylserine decarboxylase [Vicinamibacteria bacterium]
MTMKTALGNLLQQEDLNFLLTNRIPRTLLTHFMGWFCRIRNPLVSRPSLWAFRLFADDLHLEEARKRRFESLHDCFIRELKEGARPIDRQEDVLVSPCDAIVGASGRVLGTELIQAKGFPYTLADLLHDPELVRSYTNGTYITLRLKSNMYHRFHAPHDCRVERVTYISGDTWNVNPIALRRVERLYAKNERAVIQTTLLQTGHRVTLVPVAAVLVASMRFEFLDVRLHLRYKGPNVIACDAILRKGQEMGRFEQGSTIIVFAPGELNLAPNVSEGRAIRMGEPLLRILG